MPKARVDDIERLLIITKGVGIGKAPIHTVRPVKAIENIDLPSTNDYKNRYIQVRDTHVELVAQLPLSQFFTAQPGRQKLETYLHPNDPTSQFHFDDRSLVEMLLGRGTQYAVVIKSQQ